MEEVRGERPAATPAPVRVKRLCTVREREPLIALFEQIATEEGWQPSGELRAYTDRSIYFALWVGCKLVGGLQIVRPDSGGTLPCLKVWPELCVTERTDAVAHITVLAMRSEWRGKHVEETGSALFWQLAIAMWRHCIEDDIKELWLEATPRTLRCYERLGWPLQIRGALRMHWGEPCYPCSLSVREVAGSLVEKATRSSRYLRLLNLACADNSGMQNDADERLASLVSSAR